MQATGVLASRAHLKVAARLAMNENVALDEAANALGPDSNITWGGGGLKYESLPIAANERSDGHEVSIHQSQPMG